jgi:hypothetical protein
MPLLRKKVVPYSMPALHKRVIEEARQNRLKGEIFSGR